MSPGAAHGDAAGISRRSTAENKGHRYPAYPPRVEEIIAARRAPGQRPHGCRIRGLVVVLWRAGLRIPEALVLTEADLEHAQGSLLVRRGRGGRRREVGMDEWGWDQLRPGSSTGLRCRSGRCSASSTGRQSVLGGQHPRPATTSYATHTPWRWLARAFAQRHPLPTRAHRPRRHLHLPTRHRQRRSHRPRPRAPSADDPGSCGARALSGQQPSGRRAPAAETTRKQLRGRFMPGAAFRRRASAVTHGRDSCDLDDRHAAVPGGWVAVSGSSPGRRAQPNRRSQIHPVELLDLASSEVPEADASTHPVLEAG